MLPVNLVLYATTTYSAEVVKSLDWAALFVSLIVVIGGIFSGLICSATINSHRFNLIANKVQYAYMCLAGYKEQCYVTLRISAVDMAEVMF